VSLLNEKNVWVQLGILMTVVQNLNKFGIQVTAICPKVNRGQPKPTLWVHNDHKSSQVLELLGETRVRILFDDDETINNLVSMKGTTSTFLELVKYYCLPRNVNVTAITPMFCSEFPGFFTRSRFKLH
jgi:hypothetical protein